MRIPLLLATLAGCTRPAASFASMPSGAIPANDLTEALVEMAFINCTADERASYAPGVETAAAAVVKEGDGDSDGMISHGEFEKMVRSAEEEVGDAADSVIATLQSGECVVGRMLGETSATTSGNGRRLAASPLVSVLKLLLMIRSICMCVVYFDELDEYDQPEEMPVPGYLPVHEVDAVSVRETICTENQQFYECIYADHMDMVSCD